MDKQQEPGTVRVAMSFGELARGARGGVSEAVKGFSRRMGREGTRRQGSGTPIEQAKAEALRRARRREAKAAEAGAKGDASSASERLRRWRREFFRHARRFGWASELLQSEDWRKAGRALAEERLRDSAIHLAQAGLRVGSQGLGSAIGGMLGAETGPGAAVAAWAGSTFVGALGARAAGALSVHLSPEGRKPLGRGKERAR